MIKVFTSIVTLYSSAVYSPAATNQPSYINLHVSASLMLLFVNRVLFVKIECSLSLSSYVHMPLKLVKFRLHYTSNDLPIFLESGNTFFAMSSTT